MPRRKARAGAGRPRKKPAKLKPAASECARGHTDSIVQRLDDFINGLVDLTPAQVTAALGLLKTLPDLDHTGRSGATTMRHEDALDELDDRPRKGDKA